MSNLKYQSRIDGLRFIAIFMVLLEHFAMFIGRPLSAGFYGVNLFFVISGFLITSILIKDKNPFKKAYLNFLGRRSLRIFPIYYLTILLLYIIQTPNINERILYLLTYTYNYQYTTLNFPSEPYSPFWSLSVEEQFYLFFPLVVLLLRKNRVFFLAICLLFFTVASLQLFFDLFSISKYNYMGLLTNMASLSLGAIGAGLRVKESMRNIFKGKLVEVLALALLVFVNVFAPLHVQMIVWAFLNLFLVLKAYHFAFELNWLDKFLTNRKVVFVGRISYGIYLYHFIIGYYLTLYIFDPLWALIPFENFGLLSKLEFHTWIIKFPLYSLITIGVAYLSYQMIEIRFLKLKDRFFSA